MGWTEGQKLSVRRAGDGVLLTPSVVDRPRITWEEFRRRVPKHEGPAVSLEEMDAAVARMFAENADRYR